MLGWLKRVKVQKIEDGSISLVGAWIVDREDTRTLADLGDVLLEFGDGGELVYTVRGEDKNQIILLRYRIEGSTIVTDQPSAPKVERTHFSVSDNGVLTLAFGGIPYRFRHR